MWQMSGLGPMMGKQKTLISGQANHFFRYADEKIPYAIERYQNESARLFGVMERTLTEREYLAFEYSIADIICFSWVAIYQWSGVSIDPFPKLNTWLHKIAQRPAVIKGMQVPSKNQLLENDFRIEETKDK